MLHSQNQGEACLKKTAETALSPARILSRHLRRLDTVRFTILLAAFSIFFDAAVGHGLIWETDPSWTHWLIKTLIMAAVFGGGTWLMGIGEKQGVVITLVLTLLLGAYYWTLMPVSLRSQPGWLEWRLTWVGGLPFFFGLIFAGYLAALWMWRRRLNFRRGTNEYILRTGAYIFVVSGCILVAAVGMSGTLTGKVPDIQWFMVTLALTIPFLLFSIIVLRGTSITWSAVLGVLLIFLLAAPSSQRVEARRHWSRAQVADLAASGLVLFGSGKPGAGYQPAQGHIQMTATDFNSFLFPTPRDDRVDITAEINSGGRDYVLLVRQPQREDPQSRFPTFNGVGLHVDSHDIPGLPAGSPEGKTELAVFGLGDLTCGGQVLGKDLPVRVIASPDLMEGYRLELDIGDDDTAPVQGMPSHQKQVRAYWRDYTGHVPKGENLAHYLGGGSMLAALVGVTLTMNRRERRHPASRKQQAK